MIKTIAVIEGDDAAPEAMKPVVALLDSLNIGLEWVYPEVGEAAEARTGSIFPDDARALIDSADTTFFGSTSGKSGAALMYLRWGKETFANVRPCRYLSGCASPLADPDGIDFVIVRENLEDLYIGAEGQLSDLAPLALTGRNIKGFVHEMGVGRYAIKAITEGGTERVVRFSFELARKRAGQRKVTCATKHNMLRETDGLFLEVAQRVASDYPDITFESFIVDDFACRLIREPQKYDVVVMPNLYGDILSDAAGGLVGSLGLAAGPIYGSLMANWLGWRMAYLSLGGLALLGFIFLLTFKMESEPKLGKFHFRISFTRSQVLIISVASLWGFAHHGLFNFLPYYFKGAVETGFGTIIGSGFLAGFVLMLGIIGQLCGGRLGEKYPR